ncbi:uncharacterized protein [Clytia hemisphaerica]|uniref:uncharacterized protein n=1 Tax=Clytia hemisphaerica TaxID=252671 RepID=UPI0034D7846E
MDVVQALFKDVGVPVALDKLEGPSQVMTYLGIEIDSVSSSIRLPTSKLVELKGRRIQISLSRVLSLPVNCSQLCNGSLGHDLVGLLKDSLAPSTQATYMSGIRRRQGNSLTRRPRKPITTSHLRVISRFLLLCSHPTQDKSYPAYQGVVIAAAALDPNLTVYKKHFNSDGFLHGTTIQEKQNEIHMSLQINTDGVSLFKSSKMQIWPIYYTINELSPSIRYQRKYRLFAGLWFDLKKPHFKTFLMPFVTELQEFAQGKPLKTTAGPKTVKVHLLSGVFDAPAKCQFQNIVQFNGEYGCPYCLEPGITVKAGKGHTHCYPFNFDSKTGHAALRTHNQTLKHAKEAQKKMMESGKEVKICGVKGLSWSMRIPCFDVVNGLALDYLHNTLLGVVKMMMKLWFNKSYKKQTWYVGDKLKDIDKFTTKVT